jgi:hypothetical protein
VHRVGYYTYNSRRDGQPNLNLDLFICIFVNVCTKMRNYAAQTDEKNLNVVHPVVAYNNGITTEQSV